MLCSPIRYSGCQRFTFASTDIHSIMKLIPQQLLAILWLEEQKVIADSFDCLWSIITDGYYRRIPVSSQVESGLRVNRTQSVIRTPLL